MAHSINQLLSQPEGPTAPVENILPPTLIPAFVQSNLQLTPPALNFLQQVYQAISGQLGLFPTATTLQDQVNALATGGLYSYSVPASGDSIIAASNERNHIFAPAGPIATLDVTMPPEPDDGEFYEIATSQDITIVTMLPPAAETINGNTFTLLANTGVGWLYREANATWYRRY